MLDVEQLVHRSNSQLAVIDPLEMNLIVAKGIPAFSHLNIAEYKAQANYWAADVASLLCEKEPQFWKAPERWENDVHFFRGWAFLFWYFDEVLGIAYREDQRDPDGIEYTDLSDLFINGVMDTFRGTCGNMAALYVALAWRLARPSVRAVCIKLARYEDRGKAYNVEVTLTGIGAFNSPSDQSILKPIPIPKAAPSWGVICGGWPARDARNVHWCEDGITGIQDDEPKPCGNTGWRLISIRVTQSSEMPPMRQQHEGSKDAARTMDFTQ